MVTKWTQIDKIMYENRHRELSTKEIANLSNQNIYNCHAKLNKMHSFGDVTKRKLALYGNVKPNQEVRWQLRERGYGRVLKRMEKLND